MSIDIATPDIETLRRIVVGDDVEDYELLDCEDIARCTTRGDINYGITFAIDIHVVATKVRRVSDGHIFILAMTCWLEPGDTLVVTYEMFTPGPCDHCN